MKKRYFSILLVGLMILSSFSGIYALSTQDNGFKTIYVAKNGTDRNDGLTPDKAKLNLENALIAANPGDTIKVGSGVYPTNLIITKNITLIGNGQDTTIIDGRQTGPCIHIHHGFNASITGFTIENGAGGILNTGILTLKNSTIANNYAEYGGGIYNGGIATINNVIIQQNQVSNLGGGIYNDMGTYEGILIIEDSIISDNQAGAGGGIFSYGAATIRRSLIKNNIVERSAGGVQNSINMTIEDTIIRDNHAPNGQAGGLKNFGVLYLYGSNITNNMANIGGGIYNLDTLYMDDACIIKNNRINDVSGKPIIRA